MCTVDVNGDTTFEDLKEPQVVVQMALKEVPETRSNSQDDHNESFDGSYSPDIEGTIHEQYRKAGRPLTTTHLVQQERRQRALTLRTAGATFEAIAQELGWSGPSGAHYAVKKARQELNAAAPIENAEELRSVHYARLNELLSRVWPSAMGGTIDGRYIPPNIKSVREARLIVAQITDLMGVKALPEERSVGASWQTNQGGTFGPGESGPVLYGYWDEEKVLADMGKKRTGTFNERWNIEEKPPAGYIAPRHRGVGSEVEDEMPEPNSVDERTGEPIFDPRVALESD
jgi:hypothetical protein